MPLGVSAADVNALNSGGYTAAQVDAAAGMLEGLLGWHVAPEQEETLRLYTSGGPTFVLPTLTVSDVASVTKVDTEEVMADWYLAGQANDLQLLERRRCTWPRGWYSVELTHGYAEAPGAIVWAVEAMCQLVALGILVTGTSVSIDDFSGKIQTEPEKVAIITHAIDRYGLPAAG